MILIDEIAATLADLHREPGKAELIDGRIVRFMATGLLPGRIAKIILLLMSDFVEALGRGETFGDNVAYSIPRLFSGRETFSPDASYYDGPGQDDEMDFIQSAPTFAVEVRSKDGYGPSAERAIEAKRADYFEAGTKVVWDVDTQGGCIHAYSRNAPTVKRTFNRGDVADAEPALPGWRVEVNRVFTK
ncbi:MAG: Uma2 family endonuclease [Planctomycetota bacterium]